MLVVGGVSQLLVSVNKGARVVKVSHEYWRERW